MGDSVYLKMKLTRNSHRGELRQCCWPNQSSRSVKKERTDHANRILTHLFLPASPSLRYEVRPGSRSLSGRSLPVGEVLDQGEKKGGVDSLAADQSNVPDVEARPREFRKSQIHPCCHNRHLPNHSQPPSSVPPSPPHYPVPPLQPRQPFPDLCEVLLVGLYLSKRWTLAPESAGSAS